jgi:hypothetical protein
MRDRTDRWRLQRSGIYSSAPNHRAHAQEIGNWLLEIRAWIFAAAAEN